jgi:hypothetical protein
MRLRNEESFFCTGARTDRAFSRIIKAVFEGQRQYEIKIKFLSKRDLLFSTEPLISYARSQGYLETACN